MLIENVKCKIEKAVSRGASRVLATYRESAVIKEDRRAH